MIEEWIGQIVAIELCSIAARANSKEDLCEGIRAGGFCKNDPAKNPCAECPARTWDDDWAENGNYEGKSDEKTG